MIGFPLSATPLVKFKKLMPEAIIPKQATAGAACYDLFSPFSEVLPSSMAIKTINTGIAIELPPGHVGLICSRSGLAARDGIFVLNAPGIIDADYRGELKVILARHQFDAGWPDITPIVFEPGARVAQLMILALPSIVTVEVSALSQTARGDKGLGSTGIL